MLWSFGWMSAVLWSFGWSLGLFCFPGSNAGVVCCLLIFGALGNEYFLLKCTKYVSPLSAVIKCITFLKILKLPTLFLTLFLPGCLPCHHSDIQEHRGLFGEAWGCFALLVLMQDICAV